MLSDLLLSQIVARVVPTGTAAEMLAAGLGDWPKAPLAMLLAQTGWESAQFRRFTEAGTVPGQYEGNIRLGNVHPGDGARFIGRGAIQLTGRDNYEHFQAWLDRLGIKLDLTVNPELVAGPELRWLAAVFYFNTRPGLLAAARAGEVARVTSLITGAKSERALRLVRLDKRTEYFETGKRLLEAP